MKEFDCSLLAGFWKPSSVTTILVVELALNFNWNASSNRILLYDLSKVNVGVLFVESDVTVPVSEFGMLTWEG